MIESIYLTLLYLFPGTIILSLISSNFKFKYYLDLLHHLPILISYQYFFSYLILALLSFGFMFLHYCLYF